jgi:hypothetical chaperone protein
MTKQLNNFCAIDFGTSNSALAVCEDGVAKLVPLEGDATNLPTALFYPTSPTGEIKIGRAAQAAYVAFEEGRLLRSIKSVLGSALMDASTELGPGRVMTFTEIIADFLLRIKYRAEKTTGRKLQHVLMGRPAFFVDDDPEKDKQAQASLEAAAKMAGFKTVAFEFEPVAAAYAFASTSEKRQTVLVADIGGGTSDFSVIALHEAGSRILANHGVHMAGTDFDRRVSLTSIMPLMGLGASNANGRPVPNGIYRDLSTWHLVNTLYSQKSKASLFTHRDMYGSKLFFGRLERVLEDKLGHQLLGHAERAKIQASEFGHHRIELDDVEKGLNTDITRETLEAAIAQELKAISHAASVTLANANIKPSQIEALFFTGGSTGLKSLRNEIGSVVPMAKTIEGERFESVATGLGIAAIQIYG